MGKYIFRQKISKSSLLFSPKFLTTYFLIIDNFFYKIYAFLSKCTPFSLCFSFFVSVSAFFRVYFLRNKKIKKFSSDYWGDKKGVLPHHLSYWGRVPGLPSESTPMPPSLPPLPLSSPDSVHPPPSPLIPSLTNYLSPTDTLRPT